MIDSAGNNHKRAQDPRIISLVPSLTELAFNLGLENHLVGRTAFCVHPADQIKNIPSVGGTKQVNWEKIDAAAPTHALVNIDENPKELAEALEARGIEVVVTHPISPKDNIELFQLMGAVFDREKESEALVDAFQKQWEALSALKPSLPERKVLYLIWNDPLMTVSQDTYISQMLAAINWKTLGHHDDARYPEVPLNGSTLEEADFILFATEPFHFQPKHLKAFSEQYPGLKAKLEIVDGEMLSWYGSRSVLGLSYLKQLAKTP